MIIKIVLNLHGTTVGLKKVVPIGYEQLFLYLELNFGGSMM